MSSERSITVTDASPRKVKKSYLGLLVAGFFTLLSGMWVTLKNLFRKPVTLRYPRERPELSTAFRSAIDLVDFEELGTHDCVACMQCVNICPSFCIQVEGQKYEGVKRKRATAFLVDYALCSVCGLCIDVCPTDTLKYSKIYDEVAFERDAFVFDLLEPFRAREEAFLEEQRIADAKAAEEKKAAAAKKKAAAAKAAAAKAKAEAPKADEPKAEAPKAEKPQAEKAKAEAPQAEKPQAEKPQAEKPKAEAPKAEQPKVEQPKVEAEKPKPDKPKPAATDDAATAASLSRIEAAKRAAAKRAAAAADDTKGEG